jgi:hypothetical protein
MSSASLMDEAVGGGDLVDGSTEARRLSASLSERDTEELRRRHTPEPSGWRAASVFNLNANTKLEGECCRRGSSLCPVPATYKLKAAVHHTHLRTAAAVSHLWAQQHDAA